MAEVEHLKEEGAVAMNIMRLGGEIVTFCQHQQAEGRTLGLLPLTIAMVVDAMETEPNLAEITLENVATTVTLATAAEAMTGSILLAIAVAAVELAVAVTGHILSNGQLPMKEKAERLKHEIRLLASQMKSPNLVLWKLTLVKVDVLGEEEAIAVVAVEAIVETLREGRKCQILGHETIMAAVIGSTIISVLEVSTDAMIEVERRAATAVTVTNAEVRSVANTAIIMVVASSVNRSRMSVMDVDGIEREIGERNLIFKFVCGCIRSI